MMKRLFSVAALLAIGMAASLQCSSGQPKKLTILHTNDMHATYLPHEAFWVRSTPKPMIGGFGELQWTVDSIRSSGNDVLLLDAGDVMTGTPISDFEEKGAAGGALFEMMNLLGYDAWTVGNHDLDISQDNLRKLIGILKCPTVSANLQDSLGGLPFGNRPSVIVEKGGLRVGIIGLMSRDLFRLTNTNNLRGIRVESPFGLAQHLIDSLTPVTDLIVALTHEGVDDDSILAASTHGLQVIVGGHSHTRLNAPRRINGVIICQTGSNCENLGELELTVENHAVTSFEGKLIPLWAKHQLPKNELTSLVDGMKSKMDAEYGTVIGTLQSDWKRSAKGESGIGNFVADAMREGANAKIGITNSSGLRKDLSAGPIRKLDLFEIIPFRNVLCTFTMTGKELREFAGRYAQSLLDGRSSLQLSGIRCTWKPSATGVEIETLTVDGAPVVDDVTYVCATSDFVINQADKYLGLVPSSVRYSQTTVYQVLVDKVQRDKTLDSKVENRFQQAR